MLIKVGTFNLNNLFSRFNFSSAIKELQNGNSAGAMTIRYEFSDPQNIRVRTFMGKLVQAKDKKDTKAVADRIRSMDVDVLAVQEVEDIDILKDFNRNALNGLYPHQVLIEGNDPRFIDVGLLSKLPVGAITSFQTAVHPSSPTERVFSRDLLEVEILHPRRSKQLFTLYNTHLKSHFGDDDNAGQGKTANDIRRKQQAESIAAIIGDRLRSDARFILTGDMNDGPEAPPLQPMLTVDGKRLVNGLVSPLETRPAKKEADGHSPAGPAWTHRFKKTRQPPEHHLFDQIWLSQALAHLQSGAFINRRTKHGGDGSDHDPAWVELDMD